MPVESSVRSVTRAFDLLDLFDHRRPHLTLREIVDHSGLPKTTVVRLLANLEARTLLSVRSDGAYTLGAGMLRWVRLSEMLWEVNEQTRDSMRQLVDEVGETVNLYVRQDDTRVSIAQEESRFTVRNVVDLGAPMPLWAGATAKVLLTAAPAVLDHLARARPDLDANRLRAEVGAARQAGYAVSQGEREIGATAVSAPIVASDGRTLAALSISGPTSRFTDERLSTAVGAVVRTAADISTNGLGSVGELL